MQGPAGRQLPLQPPCCDAPCGDTPNSVKAPIECPASLPLPAALSPTHTLAPLQATTRRRGGWRRLLREWPPCLPRCPGSRRWTLCLAHSRQGAGAAAVLIVVLCACCNAAAAWCSASSVPCLPATCRGLHAFCMPACWHDVCLPPLSSPAFPADHTERSRLCSKDKGEHSSQRTLAGGARARRLRMGGGAAAATGRRRRRRRRRVTCMTDDTACIKTLTVSS